MKSKRDPSSRQNRHAYISFSSALRRLSSEDPSKRITISFQPRIRRFALKIMNRLPFIHGDFDLLNHGQQQDDVDDRPGCEMW
jgi:hypothetical protein